MTAGTPSARSAWTPLLYSWFRWLWIASVVSNIGTWMQNVGAAWLMTSIAPSAVMVALVQTATNLPVFMLGVPAGAVADIFDRRKLLLFSQGWMLGAAALLGGLTIAHQAGPWALLLLTFALGLGATMNGPAWQAIVPELVPRGELPSAIALNSVGFNLARAVGPALGGIVVSAIGAGAAFILNALSFVAVMAVLYLWPREPETGSDLRETMGSAMWAGLRYVRFEPALHAVLLRSGVFVVSASALWSILPLIAKVELGRESTGYGLLLTCLGAGSILGALILSRTRSLVSTEVLVTSATALFGCVSVAVAYFASFWAVAAALVLGGMAWMAVNSTLNTVAQTALPGWVRARALAVYLLVFQGAMALGSVAWGGIASRFGLRTTMLLAGLALIAGAALTMRLQLTPSTELDLRPANFRAEPHLVIEAPPDHGPVLVTLEYAVPDGVDEFRLAMKGVERIRRRDGAIRWGLFEDAAAPGRFLESFLVPNWGEHLRQHDRMTVMDRALVDRARKFHAGESGPVVTHWIARWS